MYNKARTMTPISLERVQQYFLDASEAETLMSEQEPLMKVDEDRGKDESSTLKMHDALCQVQVCANAIRQLGETTRLLTSDKHTDIGMLILLFSVEGVNVAWQELLGLMEGRHQMLVTSGHTCASFFRTARTCWDGISDELGSVSVLMHGHQNLKQDLLTVQAEVQTVREDAARLQASNVGEKAKDVADREAEVVAAWTALQDTCDAHFCKLADVNHRTAQVLLSCTDWSAADTQKQAAY
jgi:hypothetical protein